MCKINKGGDCLELNKVYCMDNLELLKQMKNNSVDLIYCDILYNTGKRFKDYNDNLGTHQEAMEWYRPRLIEMKRVLKENGNILIHCDYHINSYIRVFMDELFGFNNFRNEIIWKRSNDSGSSKSKAKKLPVCSDTILWYSKSNDYTFNMPQLPYDDKLMSRFKLDDGDGKGLYYWADLRTYSQERLSNLKENNEVKQRCSGKYSYKRYLNKTNTNKALLNIWDDINRISGNSKESQDYFSQKPKLLLKRIIESFSNEGDVVADFFCGSGTSLVVAKELGRQYIGCDINIRAIEISNERLNEVITDGYGTI